MGEIGIDKTGSSEGGPAKISLPEVSPGKIHAPESSPPQLHAVVVGLRIHIERLVISVPVPWIADLVEASLVTPAPLGKG